MGSLSVRRWIIGALCATQLLLAGCSALRLGYNQGPTLAYWWLDGYVDFDDTQTPRVKDALAEWFRWHRRTQLPDYSDLLARAGDEVQHSVTGPQVCRWIDEGRSRLNAAFEHAVPAFADVSLSLTPTQLQHIERRYAKANEEFADDYLQTTPERRREASVKRTVERAEMVYGPLDVAQRERIVRGIAASPFDPDLWTEERRARQQFVLAELRRLTEQRATPAEAQQAMRRIATRFDRSPNEAWQRYQQRLLAYNCGFAAELHNATSVAQRQAAQKRLKGWESDLRALSAQPDS